MWHTNHGRVLCLRVQTATVTAVCSLCFLVRGALVVLLGVADVERWENFDDVRVRNAASAHRTCRATQSLNHVITPRARG